MVVVLGACWHLRWRMVPQLMQCCRCDLEHRIICRTVCLQTGLVLYLVGMVHTVLSS